MKYIAFYCAVFIAFGYTAQVNVYDCVLDPIVTQAEIDANDNYYDQCVLFDSVSTYSFGNIDNKTVTAARQIDVEPGFTASGFNLGTGMTLVLCDDELRDVVAFSHSDLSNIEALKRFEFGIELPADIDQRVQDFIATGDTSGNQINPYLDWHLDAKAVFTNSTTGFTKTVYGFYFQNFERDTSDANSASWGWNSLATNHKMRFRYALPQVGEWDISINVTLQDGNSFSYCPFAINVTPNTSDDAFVEVADNDRVLQRNGELFFPIGQDLHFPVDEGGSELGVSAGAWGDSIVSSRSHVIFEDDMEELNARGVKTFRMLLNPPSLDFEFEKVGDYTDRLNLAWEIDNIVEKAEELDLYIHFNMLVHYGLEVNSGNFRLNWDWNKNSIVYAPTLSQGHFGYRDFFVASNDTSPELFLENEQCIKYYKQKIRYLISRYGYSTHISMFELLSEINNVGNHSDFFYAIDDTGAYTIPKMNHYYTAYDEDPLQPARVANWHDIMAKYIKNDLGHKEHLLMTSYAGPKIRQNQGDYSYDIPEIDIVSWNNYSDYIQRYHLYPDRVSSFYHHGKPIIWSETGPLATNGCDNGSTWRKEVWMNAFTGIAGFGFWAGAEPEFHDRWDRLALVSDFIHDTPEVSGLLMGDWNPKYIGDSGVFFDSAGCSCIKPFESELKEMVYLDGTYINPYGNNEPKIIGVVSNMTDNYYTNWDQADSSSYCYDKKPPLMLRNKQNLLANNAVLFIPTATATEFTFDWYDTDASFLSTLSILSAGPTLIIHPESCITSGCATNYNTPEIPVIISREQYAGKSLESEPNTGLSSTEEDIEFLTSELLVYPNPSNGEINISCTDTTIHNFRIVDSRGIMVSELIHAESTRGIDLTNVSNGLYVILAEDGEGFIKYQTRWVKL